MKNVIAFITDSHMDEAFTTGRQVDAREDLKNILQEVQAAGITEVIFGGDIGDPSSHPFFFDLLNKYPGNYRIVLGNHDHFNEVIPFYNPLPDQRTELYYTDEKGGYKYIFMDSSIEEISQVQLEWFKKEMQTNRKVILFIHHPILPVNAEVDRAYPLKGREKIAEVLRQHPQDVYIFCGHLHLDDMQSQGNIQQYVTPAVSLQFVRTSTVIAFDEHFFGYRIITISEEGIETTIVEKQRLITAP
ncbi:metallophosphoesterase family protein [Chitinophaga sp. RAB17]|uniref:metallophosphoesterase family protein n=1 Tax=Chitinophaga sp. RAB17 TaxID=3233049 RepID=UPI003F8FF397